MEKLSTRQRYGKRHLALQLLARGRRRRNWMRLVVAGTALMAMLASVYEQGIV